MTPLQVALLELSEALDRVQAVQLSFPKLRELEDARISLVESIQELTCCSEEYR